MYVCEQTSSNISNGHCRLSPSTRQMQKTNDTITLLMFKQYEYTQTLIFIHVPFRQTSHLLSLSIYLFRRL